jgi:hypothetical protein
MGRNGGAAGTTGRADGLVVARCWAAFASLGAGLVHAALTMPLARTWWVAGTLTAVVAGYQVGWALAALARERLPWWRVTVALNVAAVAAWAVSRTVGVPVGLGLSVGTADAVAAGLGVVLVWLVVLVARSGSRLGAVGGGLARGRTAALLGAGALVMSVVTTPALAATDAGRHARPHGTHELPLLDVGSGHHGS